MQNDVNISVIVPVYNSEKYLRECLNTITQQTLREIEIICVDDGSIDTSPNILREYEASDKRIKVISQSNAGVSAARNIGLKYAHGEYVAFVDSDDFIELNTYERAYSEAKKNSSEIVVFGGSSFPSSRWADEKLSTRNIHYRNDSFTALFNENGSRPFSVNKIYKRSLLINRSLRFDEDLSLGEDQAFLFDVLPVADSITFIQDKLYHYRQHTNSAMASFNFDIDTKLEKHLKIVRYIIQNWDNKGYSKKHGDMLAKWIMTFTFDDVKKCRYNLKISALEEITSIITSLSSPTDMDDQYKQQYDDVVKYLKTPYYPRVSVIMPIYNAEEYLAETLRCLSAQTFSGFEIILVDDGSTDNSLDIINKFASDDCRAKVIIQSHGYAGVARNNGMGHANGDYLLFLDSDDLFSADMIQKAVEKADKTKSDICVFSSDRFDQHTKKKSPMPWTCNKKYFPDELEVFSSDNYPQYIYCFTTAAPWNKLFRKSFVFDNSLRFQDTRSANDMAFVMTALAIAERITILDDTLLSYRVNNEYSLQGSQDKKPDAFYYALLELKIRLIERGVYEKVKPAFINFALDCCIYNLKSMPTIKSFEEVFLLLKNKAFEELDLLCWPKSFFYAYKPNHIFENREDVMKLSVHEYIKKYGLFENRKGVNSDNYDRPIIWALRKLRGGYQCLMDNGLKYTVQRAGEKLKNRIHK